MTQAEIRKQRKALDKRDTELSTLIRAIKREYRALEEMCDHRNAKLGTDIMGGPDGQCPDCGKCW
ncbi:MAG: Rieske 2Fe-2S domain-containing protein [Candidatus Uhrbacteria bacterium]